MNSSKAVAINGNDRSIKKVAPLSSSSETSSYISEPLETFELKRSRIKDHPFHVNVTRDQMFKLFKWTLIIFNGLLIIVILGGLFAYFTEIREKTAFKLSDGGLSEGEAADASLPGSTGPKYSWVVPMFAFAILLMIPCVGLFGAIKEQVLLLIVYGAIFIVEAMVILIFRSFWFLFPALIASAAIGLVILIKAEPSQAGDAPEKQHRSRIRWCLEKV